MEFIDLAAQQARIAPRLRERMDAVLAHGRYIMGPEVAELEKKLADYCGTKHCIGCASGTTALDLVLAAWNIGPGDAVLTTPFTFVATAESIARTGAVPVFVDIDPTTFNLDATKLEITLEAVLCRNGSRCPLPRQVTEQVLTPKVILPADIFGYPADYDTMLPLAKKYACKILEDGAQGFGGMHGDKKICACGCAATTSFFPAKPLGCYGDGGAVFTDNDELAGLVDSLRYHGRASAQDKNDNVRLGINGRLDTLQAAILLAKLDILEDEILARQTVASRYACLLEAVPGVVAPAPPARGRSAWAQYTILLPQTADRADVMEVMKAKGIPTAINYPRGLHIQKAFAYLGYRPDDFPFTQEVTKRVLSLPMHPYLDEDAQQQVVSALSYALRK